MAEFPDDGRLTQIVVDEMKHTEEIPFKELFEEIETYGNTYEFDVIDKAMQAADHRLNDTEGGTKAMVTRARKEVPLPNLRESKRIPTHIVKLFQGPGQAMPETAEKALARELADLDLIFERRHAVERAQLLTKGIITLTGDLVGNTLDFGLPAAHKVTPTVEWDLPDTCTPLTDIDAWKYLLTRRGRKPTKIYLSTSMLAKIMLSAQAQKFMANELKLEYLATGTIKRLRDLEVVITDAGYENSSGVFIPYLSSNATDQDMVLIVGTGKVGLHVSGPAIDEDAPNGWTKKFAKSWPEKKSTGRWVLLTEKAMPGLTDPYSVVAATTWAA